MGGLVTYPIPPTAHPCPRAADRFLRSSRSRNTDDVRPRFPTVPRSHSTPSIPWRARSDPHRPLPELRRREASPHRLSGMRLRASRPPGEAHQAHRL